MKERTCERNALCQETERRSSLNPHRRICTPPPPPLTGAASRPAPDQWQRHHASLPFPPVRAVRARARRPGHHLLQPQLRPLFTRFSRLSRRSPGRGGVYMFIRKRIICYYILLYYCRVGGECYFFLSCAPYPLSLGPSLSRFTPTLPYTRARTY